MDENQVRQYYTNKVLPQRAEMELKKQTVMPILDNLMNHITTEDARFSNTSDSTGPLHQGNFLWTKTSDEFDYHVNLSGLRKWNWTAYKPRYYKLGHLDLLYYLQDIDNIFANLTRTDVPLPRPEEGYGSCRVRTGQEYSDMVFDEDIIPLLARKKFKELLIEAIRSLGYRGDIKLARKKEGPILTLRIPYGKSGEVTVNMIPIIPMGISFPNHIEWPWKRAKWPSEEKVAKVKKIGINAAATTPLYWSYVFEECEKELLVDIDADGGCRKQVFRILQSLSHEFGGNTNTVITTKHIKNLLLWECEKFPHTADWAESKLAERLTGMVKALQQQLQEKEMPQYWNPKVNLLKGLDEKFLSGVLYKLSLLSRNPETFFK